MVRSHLSRGQDHNQNIHEFERIGYPDLPDLRERVSEDGLFLYTQDVLFEGDYPSKVTVDAWFPLETVDHLKALLDPDYRLFGAHGEPEINFYNFKIG